MVDSRRKIAKQCNGHTVKVCRPDIQEHKETAVIH